MYDRVRQGELSSRIYSCVHSRHIYVHVPFCRRRCSYCDFSIAVRSSVPVDEYLSALRAELNLRHPADTGAWTADTLYFGGGTPSRLGADGVTRMLEILRDRIELAPNAEVTLEANPEDITPDAIAVWRAAGINRLSIGVQTFDDRLLQWMHRVHTAEQSVTAIETARDGGIDNLSIDLIFAAPTEINRSWERDLERAVELRPSHLSLYGLTVEPSTPISRWRDHGAVVEAPEEGYEEEFLTSHRVLTGAGFRHYEVSNYALGDNVSRHNSNYWKGVPYAGLGPSAHGFDGSVRRWNERAYNRWVSLLDSGVDPIAGSETLTPENRQAEHVYLSLRTDTGVDVDESEMARIERWIEAGWATREGRRVRLTALGWLRLDSLAADLAAARSVIPPIKR